MNVNDIQKRIDAMPAAMSAKGLRQPHVEFCLRGNAPLQIMLRSAKGPQTLDHRYEWFDGSSPREILGKAEAWIANLPSAEETKRNTFLAALGKVIDLGNELGQDVGALMSEMKRISENALTDQRIQATE